MSPPKKHLTAKRTLTSAECAKVLLSFQGQEDSAICVPGLAYYQKVRKKKAFMGRILRRQAVRTDSISGQCELTGTLRKGKAS